VDVARSAEFSDVVLLQETRGEPDAMVVSHLPYGPTVFFSLSGAVMRHDIEGRGTVSEAYPHLVFHNFGTPLGGRIRTVLQRLFPVPKPDSRRVLTFSNDADYISFRHHTFERPAGGGGQKPRPSDVALTEVGPRFELHPYQVRLGTLDQDDAEVEWVLRPYMNTARARRAL
jgi:U3 small nucleolar ribonucleoprotein protein IMP4